MNAQSSDSPADVQSNLPPAKTLCLDLLLPMPAISESCVEIGHDFRDRIYSPIMTTSEHQVADQRWTESRRARQTAKALLSRSGHNCRTLASSY